ncbi:ATP-binding protein [Candidatus Latescibacterota bacterium]
MLYPSLSTNEIDALIQVSLTVNAQLDLDTVLEVVMSVTTDVMQVEASSLVLIDDEKGDLLFHVARGEKADSIKTIRMKYGEGIVGWVIQKGKSTIVNDVTQDSHFLMKIDEGSGFTTKSILCVPLKTKENVWGAIEILNKLDASDFNEHDQELCEAIASQAAIAIENAKFHEQIVNTERLVAIGQTIAGLAHCVKNILNGIQGGTYMVDAGLRYHDSSKFVKGWEIVKKNNSFLQELMLDMLSYSKKREPEYELVNVNEIIESLCTVMTMKAKEKNITMRCNPSSSLNQVITDPKSLKRCVLNLITNAIDACEQNETGCVEVSTNVLDDDAYSIVISDNGHGIPEEDKKKIFQMFFSTKGSKGTGLGLAVTHKIITELDGMIDMESEVGKGTRFTITLPMVR